MIEIEDILKQPGKIKGRLEGKEIHTKYVAIVDSMHSARVLAEERKSLSPKICPYFTPAPVLLGRTVRGFAFDFRWKPPALAGGGSLSY